MPELALIGDLRLVFDPSMSNAQLSNNAFFNTDDDTGAVEAILENAESEFELRADDSFSEKRIRTPEVIEVEQGGHNAYKAGFSQVSTDYTPRPSKVTLGHSPVLPIDPDEGDSVEVRTGMNSWEDITANDNNQYDLVSPVDGKILVDFRQVQNEQGVRVKRFADERFVRVSYRYGATGGRGEVGGQTELTGTDPVLDDVDNTPSTVSVADATRLPDAPAVLLIDETEYVSVSKVDVDNDEITVQTRGERLTDTTSHDSGATVHYAPLFVRTAIAKKAAIEMTQNDQYSEWLPDTDMPLDAPRKIDEWRNDWQTALEVFGGG